MIRTIALAESLSQRRIFIYASKKATMALPVKELLLVSVSCESLTASSPSTSFKSRLFRQLPPDVQYRIWKLSLPNTRTITRGIFPSFSTTILTILAPSYPMKQFPKRLMVDWWAPSRERSVRMNGNVQTI
jgi:hypothetical protein